MADAPPDPIPEFRHPHFVEHKHDPLPELYDAEGYPVIEFAPVPQLRKRPVGWDEARQRAFIALLARTPSVGHAARAVGLSARSAYKLLDKPGADEFARAWDQALDHGMTRLRTGSMARAMVGGDFVPVYRKGRLLRIEHRPNDKLAIALLSGRAKDIDHYRRGAQVRWRQKREWAAVDAAKQAKLEEEAEARAENARWLEEMLERARNLPRPEPRIRFL
ncbi:hypothetical protein [Sphingomonas sp. LY160]|uniref:hypothetical protein n=1 Tax=Sphingomonas sp. LY160 TaxID=3095342 RepID=UPI002ADEBE46|nr:hypothetical protein [Sphingomonas sp. LY160]MEA1073033.1 hypothetical protein [Sphingomonas sp. LY160]